MGFCVGVSKMAIGATLFWQLAFAIEACFGFSLILDFQEQQWHCCCCSSLGVCFNKIQRN